LPPSPPTDLISRFTSRPYWRRELVYAVGALVAAALVALVLALPGKDRLIADHPIVKAGYSLKPVSFDDLPGFAEDDLPPAFETFLRSCARGRDEGALAEVCLKAETLSGSDAETVRAFFVDNFRAYSIKPKDGDGVVTAYYEPVVPGSREKTGTFTTPLYPLPPDLVQITDKNRPEEWDEKLTWARKTGQGFVPFATRADIDNGALDGVVKPLVYVEDAVEAFYIHIQGSTRIELPDGSLMRVGYAGKNGHPYSSVGKAMQAKGIVPEGGFSMDAMRAFFRANPEQAETLMQENRSYIFFREIAGLAPELGPIGGEGVPLTAKRSIAVDTAYHRYGTPIFIDADLQTGKDRAREPFRHLMIAQDAGSAIKGPARADLFWGTGTQAGSTAGGIKASGTFTVLVPDP
jgi:membrane-bound lytic murein transglycosylase A